MSAVPVRVRWAILPLLLILALTAMVSCTASPNTTPEATPTPTPTATPVPTLRFPEGIETLDLACLINALGTDVPDTPFSLGMESPPEVIAALEKCGISWSDIATGAPIDVEGLPFTQEQMACILEAVGGDAMAMLSGQAGELSLEMIAAILECNISWSDIAASVPSTGAPVDVEGLPFTQEQMACILEAVGGDAMAMLSGQAGELSPEMIAAILKCGLDLDSLLKDGGS